MSKSLSSYFDVKSMIFNEKEHEKIINLLLKDRTTRNNIIWATDGYKHRGKEFYPPIAHLNKSVGGYLAIEGVFHYSYQSLTQVET